MRFLWKNAHFCVVIRACPSFSFALHAHLKSAWVRQLFFFFGGIPRRPHGATELGGKGTGQGAVRAEHGLNTR